MTDSVHQALESLGSIHETKWHSEKLVQPKRGDNGGFGNIVSGHGNLVG